MYSTSGDPLSNMSISFDTKEEAIAYAVKSGKVVVKALEGES